MFATIVSGPEARSHYDDYYYRILQDNFAQTLFSPLPAPPAAMSGEDRVQRRIIIVDVAWQHHLPDADVVVVVKKLAASETNTNIGCLENEALLTRGGGSLTQTRACDVDGQITLFETNLPQMRREPWSLQRGILARVAKLEISPLIRKTRVVEVITDVDLATISHRDFGRSRIKSATFKAGHSRNRPTCTDRKRQSSAGSTCVHCAPMIIHSKIHEQRCRHCSKRCKSDACPGAFLKTSWRAAALCLLSLALCQGVSAFLPNVRLCEVAPHGKQLVPRIKGDDFDDPKESVEKPRKNVERRGLARREFVAWSAILAGAAASGTMPEASNAYSPLSNLMRDPSKSTMSKDPSVPIIPFSSVRRYKSITLANGMKVLLVSDKTARTSSAALTIRGAGQFSDPPYLSGLAHLMEHVCLSSATRPRRGDFEEWLNGDYADGFSNGFTAYEKVCFHFQCQTEAFAEALERFSRLFLQEVVQQACNNRETVRRETRRVNAELDKNDLFTRELYLTKSLINPQHPYSKMSMGSLETLERLPAEADINIYQELFQFFLTNYQPSRAILVVIGPSPTASLEGWVQPFASTLSRKRALDEASTVTRSFPQLLLPRSPINTYCLFRKMSSADILADNLEKISFQWALDQDYSDLLTNPASNDVVTATQIGFVMAEILGRRGPGTLFTILKARKWVPDGTKGVPRISFPLDVTGCQIMRLELTLTLEGFANRSSVIATVFDCLAGLRGPVLSRGLVAQYCTVAQLYGHVLAPRSPDAIELAFDGQIYGVDETFGVGSGNWRLLPLPDNIVGVQNLQKSMQSVLDKISDASNTIIIVTASQRAIQAFEGNVFEEPFPIFSPASWDISPVTGARYLPENNLLTGKINEWLTNILKEGDLTPPVLNPLIPPNIRPARVQNTATQSTNELLEDFKVLAVKPVTNDLNQDPMQTSIVQDYWSLLKVFSHDEPTPLGLSLPRISPEPSPRAVFVLQLLSSRPPRATAKMAANAEIWKISLEYALSALAELGVPAGLAYEISFNKFGMRIAFLGLSQNIASYARRISRRIVDHQNRLLEGPEKISDTVVDASIREASRFRMSLQRKTLIVNLLREATALDASREGTAFFQSCSGAVAFAEGDMLPSEALLLLGDLKKIFRKVIGSNVSPTPAIPDIESDLIYRASWIPRSASTCSIAGASLISNPCGRVPR
jgi:insulysin